MINSPATSRNLVFQMLGILLLSALGSPLLCGGAAEGAILLGNQPDPSFAGLKVWYNAGSIGVGEGNPVTAWSSSDVNPNAAAGAGSRRPTWTAAGLNAQPEVQFDGLDDQLIMADHTLFSAGGYPNTIFAVLTTSATNAHVIGLGSSSAGFIDSYGSGLIVSSSRATAKANNNSVGVFLQSTSTNFSAGALIAAIVNGSTNEMRIGGAIESTSGTAVNPWPYTRATLGASDGSASGDAIDPFSGSISEILIYGALTEEEIDDVNQYLFNKYFVEASATVPEPAAGTLLLLSAASLAWNGKRRIRRTQART